MPAYFAAKLPISQDTGTLSVFLSLMASVMRCSLSRRNSFGAVPCSSTSLISCLHLQDLVLASKFVSL